VFVVNKRPAFVGDYKPLQGGLYTFSPFISRLCLSMSAFTLAVIAPKVSNHASKQGLMTRGRARWKGLDRSQVV
jgi:hypothetical protein